VQAAVGDVVEDEKKLLRVGVECERANDVGLPPRAHLPAHEKWCKKPPMQQTLFSLSHGSRHWVLMIKFGKSGKTGLSDFSSFRIGSRKELSIKI
jgi:hypothetical protein